MMEIMFVAMAWFGLQCVFAFVLLITLTILVDPKGGK